MATVTAEALVWVWVGVGVGVGGQEDSARHRRRSSLCWLDECQLQGAVLRPGGILQTVAGCQPYRWLQLGLWTKMALSLRHSAKTSPPM